MLYSLTVLKRTGLLLFLFAALGTGIAVYWIEETRELAGVVRDVDSRQPIAGASVSVAGRAAATDPTGRYTLSIPRGKYALTALADGYQTAYSEINGEELFKRTFAIDFELPPNQLSGIVRDAETQQPLPYAQVIVGEKVFSADARGAFQLRGVKNGWRIAANAPGYRTTTLTLDGTTSDFAVALVPNSLTITLTDQSTRQPIPNATVQVAAQSIATNAQGLAILRRIPAGAILRVNAAGYEGGSVPINSDNIALSLRANTLDGVITDAATNQPISGTLVLMGAQSAATNAKGAFHFENVPAKTTLTVKTPGYRRVQIEVSQTARADLKLAPFTAKAIHIPMGLTGERVGELIDLVNKTELNSIVIDVKSEHGRIAWESAVPLAKQISAESGRTFELNDVIQRCRAHNIYCIARLAVFQDFLLATARPAFALRYPNGAVFTETGGAAWTNPLSPDVWDYNIALAKEIAAMGFDEVQFDYVRFPGFYPGLYAGANANEDARVAAIAGFLARAQKELRGTNAFLSADVFGLTTATDDDQYTGQRLKDLGLYLDYVSPMVYPDTWTDASYLVTNGLGVRNCREAVECPYDIIYNSFKRAAEKTNTRVRLWLQAYPGRGDYGIAQYKTQKKAAQDAGSAGWMFWNAQGNYDVRMFGAPGQ
ncbi:MAG: carboxypeptidase-like regulatory domain-containing protein [Chloroflexi bacterium]|nr:carboxypeptidase-like regulatory domain-containing protein [Chloroflexota bacterium]